MASSSSSSSSSRSWKYDVFLSFRGEDTRKNFVNHLYYALNRRMVHTYKDDETLPRGDTIGPSLLNAIDDSQIAVIILSENYANSSWCLDELEYIMTCWKQRGLIVMPIFYDVQPSEVRKQNRKYEEAFAKHELENNDKVDSWRKALVDASNIAGWETANKFEAAEIEDIVGTILDKLLSFNYVIDENLVGMGTRLQYLKSHLEIGSGGVRMVGIWGIGGGGKTTLASSLYIEISSKFDSCCFLENIKDESRKPDGMKTLQEKILSTFFNKKLKVESVEIGKHQIKRMLGCRKVLIVLDDVDDRKQLEALAGSRDWFGDGSRIIITTRDGHLLTHRVDEVYRVSLLSNDEAIRLFNRCAYNENNLVEDYKVLSQRVVSYAGGLPLALRVLGSFLYDKDKDEWISTLDRLKDIPEMEIVEKLKISYDGLKPLEKELFLDIACFFTGMEEYKAKPMLEACGFHPGIGVKVLIQKALITVSKWGRFDMHDLVQEMGHFIVRAEHPTDPEKHSRLWRDGDIEELCSGSATMENDKIEAIICHYCPSSLCKLVSNAKKLRLLCVHNTVKGHYVGPDFLSNELRYLHWERYPGSKFPKSFQPRKLVVLKLGYSLQKELWKGCKSLPCLKELEVSSAPNLVMTPDFGGLSCLEKLTLKNCDKLKEIHSSLGNHTSLVYMYIHSCKKLRKFPTIVHMGKLEILDISDCDELSKFPKIKANMDSLVELSLRFVKTVALPSTVGKYCSKLRSLKLEHCLELKNIKGNIHPKERSLYNTWQPLIHDLPRFLLKLTLCHNGVKDGEILCDIGELSNLQELDLSGNDFSRFNFSLLQLSKLKLLQLWGCNKLVELPELPSNIAILSANYCTSLEVIGDIFTNCKWLCKVLLRWGRSVIGSERLLQAMLQGNAIDNRCMSLHLQGLEIPKGLFIPRLLKGGRYRLQLPENWYNHFSGFLMCVALGKNDTTIDQYISMKHDEKGGATTVMDSQHDMYWEDNVGDKETWVGYVSFGSLKDTTWWDPTSTAIEFSIKFKPEYAAMFSIDDLPPSWACSGFGVRLVSKTSETGQMETTTDSFESSKKYTCGFCIQRDSKTDLVCGFSIEQYDYVRDTL